MLEETLELHQLRSSGIRDPRAGRRELNQYLFILNNIIFIFIIFIRIIINYYYYLLLLIKEPAGHTIFKIVWPAHFNKNIKTLVFHWFYNKNHVLLGIGGSQYF